MTRSIRAWLRCLAICWALSVGACTDPNEPTPTIVGPDLEYRQAGDRQSVAEPRRDAGRGEILIGTAPQELSPLE